MRSSFMKTRDEEEGPYLIRHHETAHQRVDIVRVLRMVVRVLGQLFHTPKSLIKQRGFMKVELEEKGNVRRGNQRSGECNEYPWLECGTTCS